MFNPFLVNSVLHMFFATLETSLFVVGELAPGTFSNSVISIFSMSLKIVLAATIAVFSHSDLHRHLSGEQVYRYQPTKLAAMEAQWETIPAGWQIEFTGRSMTKQRGMTGNCHSKCAGLNFRTQTKAVEPSWA